MAIETKQIGLRLKIPLLKKFTEYCEREGRSQIWVIDKALSAYLDLTQKEPTGLVSVSEKKPEAGIPVSAVKQKPLAKKVAVVDKIDYTPLNLTNWYLDEINRIRSKNAKTAKQAKMTQRIINALAKEFGKAYLSGFSIDQILDEWETRGWQSFKAEWMKPNNQQGRTIEHDSTRTRDQSVAKQLTDDSWAN